MVINRYKYDIEVRDDDAIKHNRIFFDFMQQTFSFLDELYMDEKCLFMDTIKKDELRNQSSVKFKRLYRDRSKETKKRYI